MKTKLKKLMWSLLIIIVGVIMFNASTLLGWIYVAILIAIGCLIFVCKTSAGNEEKIIKLESLLNEPHCKAKNELCKKLLSEILPSELPDRLYRRYKEAEKMFNEKY
jgi:predicted membrane protein